MPIFVFGSQRVARPVGAGNESDKALQAPGAGVHAHSDRRGRPVPSALAVREPGYPMSTTSPISSSHPTVERTVRRGATCGRLVVGERCGLVLRIKSTRLVYLDAFVWKMARVCTATFLRRRLSGTPTWRVHRAMEKAGKSRPYRPKSFKVNASDADWVDRQCTAAVNRDVSATAGKLTGGIEKIKNVTFILATRPQTATPFPKFTERAKAKGWKTLEMNCGHDVMLDMPVELNRGAHRSFDARSCDLPGLGNCLRREVSEPRSQGQEVEQRGRDSRSGDHQCHGKGRVIDETKKYGGHCRDQELVGPKQSGRRAGDLAVPHHRDRRSIGEYKPLR